VQLLSQPRGGTPVLLHLGLNQLAYVNAFLHAHARFCAIKEAWTIPYLLSEVLDYLATQII
jgi:hypothetical protein